MLFMQNKTLTTVCLAFALQLAAQGSAWSKDVFPMHQGMHEWPVAGGKVTAVVGTYQDTTTFRRSYNFFSEINFFAFTKFGQSKSLQKIKAKYSSVGSGTHHSHRITFENKAALTTLDSLILLSSDSSPQVLFCEVTLKKPKGAAVQHFNYDDKWYFPVEAEKLFSSWWTLPRPSGEKGELPDWDWLGKAFPEKYPVAEDARKW